MADVGATLVSWSSTTASNSPAGATTIGTGLDDNLREIQGVIVRGLSHKGSDIASVAGTTDIGAVEGLFHDVTGAETITGLGTVRAGIWKVLKFEGAATLTHNATTLILPGAANIVCAAGDIGVFASEGSGNWRCFGFLKTNGSHLGPLQGTEQATTSGTAINFTGIPPWAKKITLQFFGVSTNGTATWLVQIGDSGGLEDSGYLGAGCSITNGSSPGTAAFTAGFGFDVTSAAAVAHGTLVLTLEDAAAFTWIANGTIARSDAAIMHLTAGSKSLSAALDRLTITTTGGTDAFDLGAVNVIYE